MALRKWPDTVSDKRKKQLSSSNNSTSSAFQKRSIEPKPAPTLKPALDGGDCGRMFFAEKAKVILLPEEDHLAASIYADAKLWSLEGKQTVTPKEHTSGYDFGEMLKNQDFTISWGKSSSSRCY